MKYRTLLTPIVLLLSLFAIAQKSSNKAFAITSEKQGQYVWTEVKLIDLNTGEVLQNIFENNRSTYNVFDARNGNSIRVKDEKGPIADRKQMPFSTFSAACAYDKKHNRLYYTPMFINQLRYIDLNAKTPKIYYFEGENFSKADNLENEANHITRMVIAADGNGYGLSNDANHLVKFTTGRKPQITDLGALQDDAQNGQISVHNRCSSWGGDMVGDAFGNIYMISASHSIFKIDLQSRMATYSGAINGLPSKFTTNGAVIDNDGNLVVCSANSTEGYYVVDMKNWKATRIETNNTVFNASDLASANLAFEKEVKQQTIPSLFSRAVIRNDKISIYPNPVSEGLFRVSFDSKELGRYDIQLIDLLGRVLVQKVANIGNEGQVVEIEVGIELSKGTYMVKVLNNVKKTVLAEKIIIE